MRALTEQLKKLTLESGDEDVKPSYDGLFVAFEGIDGVGKSTQRDGVAELLEASGIAVTRTAEPGGTPLAEKLRQIIKFEEHETISTEGETLLFYASRELHLSNVIRPHLADKKVVLCDRFADSTEAYQMAGGKLNSEFAASLRKHIVGDTEPDLTFVFIMDVEKAFARIDRRGKGAIDRMEIKGRDYYVAAQGHFVAMAHDKSRKTEYVIVNADQDQTVIRDLIVNEIAQAWQRKHGTQLPL